MPETVWAVVVTFERSARLRECLTALRAQTRPPETVLVVDNASRDDTPDMVRTEFPEVTLLALTINGGGAGGFATGLERALAGGADLAWLLDDDTIPRPDALGRLLAARTRAPEAELLASAVEWSDGTLHPMNLPGLWRDDVEALI
ncbi:MAG: glycosyltransferase, partial [Solirubrobacteraceae bacterium]